MQQAEAVAVDPAVRATSISLRVGQHGGNFTYFEHRQTPELQDSTKLGMRHWQLCLSNACFLACDAK